MKPNLDERDLIVLESISETHEPIGSWALVESLESRNFKVSSASIGRILYRLEKMGYVEGQGNKGRIITNAGLKAIEHTKALKTLDSHRIQLETLINSKVLEDFIMVLQARKAIERETSRLAAENVTDASMNRLKQILEEQEIRAKKGESIAEIDVAFHREIAKASHNSALMALYEILSTMGQQSELFEFVRSQVDATYRQAHRSVLQAIQKHDPDDAERCIIRHMDALIEDVTKYWDRYYE